MVFLIDRALSRMSGAAGAARRPGRRPAGQPRALAPVHAATGEEAVHVERPGFRLEVVGYRVAPATAVDHDRAVDHSNVASLAPLCHHLRRYPVARAISRMTRVSGNED